MSPNTRRALDAAFAAVHQAEERVRMAQKMWQEMRGTAAAALAELNLDVQHAKARDAAATLMQVLDEARTAGEVAFG